MRYLVYISFLLFLLPACTHSPEDSRLLEAEKLMEQHPDSSQRILMDVDSSAIKRKADKALYSLLLSQALDKNYVDLASDSIISTAVEYYSSSDDLRRKMLSQYYYGRVRYNASDYPQSLVAMFKALDIAKELDEPFWIGMAARGIADIYSETFNGAEELKYTILEYESMKRAGRILHVNDALLALSKAYNNNAKYRKGYEVASQLLDSAYTYEDIYQLAGVYRVLGYSSIGMDDYENAVFNFEKLCDTGIPLREDSILLGIAYANNGNLSKASQILISVETPQKETNVEWLKCEIYSRENSYQKAYVASKASDSLNNKIFARRINTNLSGSVVNHYALLNMVNRVELKAKRIQTWLILTISLAVILFIITGVFIYRKKQEEIIEKNVLLAEDLRRLINLKEDEYSAIKMSVHTLLTSKFEILDELCKAIYENPKSSIARKRVSDMMERTVNDMISNPKKIEELEGFVNRHYSNLMSDFRTDFPNFKDIDYRLFLFTVLGFSISSISVLINEPKITSIYDRKRRIKDKIKHSDISNPNRYLELL